MNFSVLLPEINSALMFAGAGRDYVGGGVGLTAGQDLGLAAASFSAVTRSWPPGPGQGPASAAMTCGRPALVG